MKYKVEEDVEYINGNLVKVYHLYVLENDDEYNIPGYLHKLICTDKDTLNRALVLLKDCKTWEGEL